MPCPPPHRSSSKDCSLGRAASSFKKRALEKLAKRLYLLFLREYDRPTADLHEQEIIEEWKERFYKQGENKRCVVRSK